jgi:broad specificity phosphatase PhoE
VGERWRTHCRYAKCRSLILNQCHVYISHDTARRRGPSGQHTGRVDLPLNADGEANGRRLASRLAGILFKRMFTSPLTRARRTRELAGFGASAVIDSDLLEWDYGAYEGKTQAQIRSERPGWESAGHSSIEA